MSTTNEWFKVAESSYANFMHYVKSPALAMKMDAIKIAKLVILRTSNFITAELLCCNIAFWQSNYS